MAAYLLERRIAHRGSNGDKRIGARDRWVRHKVKDSRNAGFASPPWPGENLCRPFNPHFEGTLPPKTSFIGDQHRIAAGFAN
ncbi:hypothetical protein [Mesorhizobium sp.]|uniref:hypothetical protein n=1 Tax=Mesorhizobium sp. TaxID=1871066 RepID=UPI000FE9B132|nr:hypothetical protein [Mesorhizobium sp.]RWK42900.1 MAG: hypothetical protein EOR46_09155 [Mesorhizobium sp.]RWK70361.1 MAG: hypothetical protein EOR54_05030 [Mesorhizobium sp.]RWK80623.1 MAG: hypothetical protein EOR50_03505 [Mesorhizobium sp.]RWK83179.1 MAG: hypothetical protein EOR51_08565 [Mesorhizobium sp.]RWL09081.1 MAG: hypothetical protein EOR55_02055 [Mesorhizobium sp.]